MEMQVCHRGTREIRIAEAKCEPSTTEPKARTGLERQLAHNHPIRRRDIPDTDVMAIRNDEKVMLSVLVWMCVGCKTPPILVENYRVRVPPKVRGAERAEPCLLDLGKRTRVRWRTRVGRID